MRELTTQQRRILIWLSRYQQKNFTTPSYKEMAGAFGISVNTIKQHIHALQKKEFIRRNANAKRSIVVLKNGEATKTHQQTMPKI